MIKDSQGSVVSLVVMILEFAVIVALAVFSYTTYLSRQDYKNNVDSKIAAAVAVAKNQQGQVDATNYANQAKYPLANYTGPSDYGSISVNYPKTWSAYVDTTSNNYLVDGYFNPNYVPSINSQTMPFSLRVQIINQPYSTTMNNFSSLQQNGLIKVSAYSLPKVPQVVGVMITGQIVNNLSGTMVVLPLRNETLEIWTIGQNYISDFNNIILPDFSFSP